MQMPFNRGSKVVPVRQIRKAKNQLLADFNSLLEDAEELLRSTASSSGEAVHGARSKLEDSLQQMKTRLSDAQSAMATSFDRTAAATQAYAHDNPWKIAGAAAVVGLLIGAIVSMRR
ncbi:MAG TPA: DUF883 family protein [Burkholderiales bacterium]|nr:DUF883 family protein [Burkholderiales bacterium]